MLELFGAKHLGQRKLKIRAAGYPYDAGFSGLWWSNNEQWLTPNGIQRSWHLMAYNPKTRLWFTPTQPFRAQTFIHEQVVSNVVHARFDTWLSDNRTDAQEGFCEVYDQLPSDHIIIVIGSHAPPDVSPGMSDRLLDCGGTTAKFPYYATNPHSGWSAYILVGKKGLGAGNGYVEVVNNLPYINGQGVAEVEIVI
jgi:hypothetical protein